ncbi:MAG: RNA polymerase sigma factor [Candidatus Paceibacterota bacterium]|jgi:RNA polymerase sigma-70 factor (ECF subfamily)
MEDIKGNYIKAYDEYVDALFRYASFNVRDRETAKDIVSETFTKTWSYIAGGGQIENMKAFLYRTLKNLIIDHYRAKKAVSLDTLAEDEHFDPAAEPEVSIEEHAESMLAFGLLDQIPQEYKDVVVMRCVQGLSFREIAVITSEQENTVAVRFHRALKKVKDLFNRESEYEK